ncbi:MAG: DNA helicase RecQ [Phycisphaerae bacterium]
MEDISLGRILEPVRRFWGFDRLRPLQEEAIRAGISRRDSLVVLPTGGGKSLCYQVPPVLAERIDVVVSPLISLMKDQVDGLRACGYPAACLHSGMTPEARDETSRGIGAGKYRLLFVSPERILTPWFLDTMRRIDVCAFAIDEAHCISHWGHDFRPDYRQLATLKARLRGASVHAYTATATERVREDIVAQLGLCDPAVLVGAFDRPNLTYRVVPRVDAHEQTADVIRRHDGEAVIVYCLSRKDTERMASYLSAVGITARAYHAGLSSDERRRTQDAFAEESLNVVAATVAFGMGIDRSNVRCVVHATMPKSIEHYQQETGRAGRDGLEAECVLLYSGGDVVRWQRLLERSASGEDVPEDVLRPQFALLAQMQRFCGGVTCRHQALVRYFGQAYDKPSCGACDVCLEEVEGLADATVVAQKILSCVARVEERFGAGHVMDVLLGADTERVRRYGHGRLSTYGLMKGTDRKALTNMLYQLVDQGLMDQSAGKYTTLSLNRASWDVLRGDRSVRLIEPKSAKVKKTRYDEASWDGVDRGLFDDLRALRKRTAGERGVPPYVIFSDATLRDLARVRPTSDVSMLAVHGVGRKRLVDLGASFLARIRAYCAAHDLRTDVVGTAGGRRPGRPARPMAAAGNAVLDKAFELFAAGVGIDAAAETLGRARGTTTGYLAQYIETKRPERIDEWVTPEAYAAVKDAIDEVGMAYLRPIFEKLDGAVPYDTIRLVVAHVSATPPDTQRPA